MQSLKFRTLKLMCDLNLVDKTPQPHLAAFSTTKPYLLLCLSNYVSLQRPIICLILKRKTHSEIKENEARKLGESIYDDAPCTSHA